MYSRTEREWEGFAMKKVFAVMLAVALMLTGAALGEGFAFRNGVAWGMTPDEVLATEGDAESDRMDAPGGLTIVIIDDIDFDGIEGDANYVFLNDALVVCGYTFELDDTSVEAVAEKAVALYGEPTDTDPAELTALLAQVNDAGDIEDDAYYVAWHLEDGTLVALTDNFGDVELAYVDAVGIRAGSDAEISEPAPALEP